MNTLPPADKVQQIVSVGAQGGVRQTANIFAIQVTIDPGDLATGGLLDDTNRTLCVVGGRLMDQAELHGRAASRELETVRHHRPGRRRSSDRGPRAGARGEWRCLARGDAEPGAARLA